MCSKRYPPLGQRGYRQCKLVSVCFKQPAPVSSHRDVMCTRRVPLGALVQVLLPHLSDTSPSSMQHSVTENVTRWAAHRNCRSCCCSCCRLST